MSVYETELRQKWDSIDFYSGGSLQLSIPHALQWHVRYESESRKSLVIVSDIPAGNVPSSQSIEAACNQRRDGKFAIVFTLVNREQEDVFISMAGDIIEYSRSEAAQKGALTKVLSRYAQWLKLLDHKRSTLLSENAQKGLIAELSFLTEALEQGMSPADALSGWVGPESADQDFVYADGWHEIKAVGASSAMVTISSVEQLESTGPGELVVYRIDKCAPAQSGATTLYRTIHDIIAKLAASPNSINDFVMKLASVGYIDLLEYDTCFFAVSSRQRYSVDNTFPKLCRADLPAEIVSAEYQISLPSISAWIR